MLACVTGEQPSSPLPWGRILFVGAVGCWLVLRQIDLVLKSLQDAQGVGGYGANALGPLWPAKLSELSGTILGSWDSARTLSRSAFYVYTAVDFVFIAVYGSLLLVVVSAVRFAQPAADGTTVVHRVARIADWAELWILLAAAADVVENLLRLVVVGFEEPSPWLLWPAWAMTVAKFGFLALAATSMAAAWSVAPGGRATLTPLVRLRLPAVVLGVFSLLMLFDPTGQVADIFRRWLDGFGTFFGLLATTLAGVALLSWVTWSSAWRAVLASGSVSEWANRWRRAIIPGAIAAVLALLVGAGEKLDVVVVRSVVGCSLLGPALVLAVLAVAELVKPPPGVAQAENLQKALARAPKGDESVALTAAARGLATLPVVVLPLALASAWTAPAVVLHARGLDPGRAWPAALLTPCMVVVAAWLSIRVPKWLKELDASPAVRGIELPWLLGAVACAAGCAVAIAWETVVPPDAGAVAITALALATLLLALMEGQRFGDVYRPPGGLQRIGFVRTPVTLLVVIAVIVASLIDDGTHHAVLQEPDIAAREVTLPTAFDEWLERNCAMASSPDRGTVPLVLVAGQGGGMRAAYWTTATLTKLLAGQPRAGACGRAIRPFDAVFAMSGASGGSLGVTSYAGRARGLADPEDRWYQETWGRQDLVAVPVAWGLLVDLPRTLIGFDVPDRAEKFEEAWEDVDPPLAQDFFASQADRNGPLLLLAGTQVESGCRINISAVRLTSRVNGPGECGGLERRWASNRVAADPAVQVPGAALTSDILDHLCGQGSLRRATAALMSARFPYVSPSGGLSGCGGDTAVVDGGYAENTGGQGALDLWRRLEPLVAAHNAAGDGPTIVPVFVHVDNHYSKPIKGGPPERTRELLVPPTAYLKADTLDNRGVEQSADAAFSTTLPGRPGWTCDLGGQTAERYLRMAPSQHLGLEAPLAWTLSGLAMDDLDRQLDAVLDRADGGPQRLRAALNGDAGALRCAGPPAAGATQPR
jgi:hypothetical protein